MSEIVEQLRAQARNPDALEWKAAAEIERQAIDIKKYEDKERKTAHALLDAHTKIERLTAALAEAREVMIESHNAITIASYRLTEDCKGVLGKKKGCSAE